MSDFNKYSNYTEESSFSSVVFGSNRPLLEVELNEVQQIINSKFTKIMKALGVKILFLSDPTYSDGVLTIDSALVFEEDGGYIFEVKEASIECGEDNEIYLQIEEKVVDSSTELHSYGNSTSDIIANHIKDERYSVETAKRKCVTYTLMADSEVPNSTDTIKYIGVAKIEGEDIIYTDSSITESLLAQARKSLIEADSMQSAINGLNTTVGYTKKNLIPYPYSETTMEKDGMTITDNGDGTITVNGEECLKSIYFIVQRFSTSTMNLKKGKYILNGCPQGGTPSTYNIYVTRANSEGNTEVVVFDYGEGAEFTLEEDTIVGVSISITQGMSADNLVFKPMIRYAHIEDGTYEPYVADMQTQIKTVDEKVLTLEHKEIELTTDAYGNCSYGLPYGTQVINAFCINHLAAGVIPIICSGNMLGGRVISNSETYTPLANTPVTISITYLK